MPVYISHSGQELISEYQMYYEWKDCPGAGYGFDCDENGNLTPGKNNRDSVSMVQQNLHNFNPPVIQDLSLYVRVSAVILCECGRKLELYSSWANDCVCGNEYNGGGQLLADRSQWGEETGERF